MNIKKPLGLLLVTASLLLGACSNNNPSPTSSSEEPSSSAIPEGPFQTTLNVKLEPSLNETKVAAKESYNLQFAYSDGYFLKDAKAYDKDLSLLSFGSAMVSADVNSGKAFFEGAEFKDFYTSGYESAPSVDSIGFMLAHKTINDSELFAVTVRGLSYGLEWTNNFLLGNSGDHLGFSMRAREIYLSLQAYIFAYAQEKPVKIWVSGYSRAGAVSNVLSHLIMTGDKFTVDQSNLFAYTFEAPACLETKNCVAYENVHNINNENDLIPTIPPTKFGFGRCGVTYPIYDANFSSIMAAFDAGVVVPELVPIDVGEEEPLDTDNEVIAYLLDCVFNYQTTDEEGAKWTCNTREEYCDHYQQGLSNMIGLIFGLTEATRSAVLTDLQELGFGALMVLQDGSTLAAFIKTYLDRDQVPYNETTLENDCTALRNAVLYLFMRPLLLYLTESYKPTMTRLVDMHYPESVYVLLVNAHNKQ